MKKNTKPTKPDRETLARRRQFTRQFYRGNRATLAFAMAACILAAAVNLAISWLLQQTVDLATGAGGTCTLGQLALITLGLLAGCAVLDAASAWARPRFLSRAIAQYREYAYAELLKKNLATFTREDTAVYLSALSNDANSIETNYLQKMFEFWGNAVLFAGALVMMFFYSAPLAVVALVLSALPLAVSMLLGPRLARAETALSAENARFVAAVKEGLGGFSVVKSFQAERQAYGLFAKSSRRVQDAMRRRLRENSILGSVGSTVGAAAQMGVFLVGCWMALAGRGITPGVLVIFVNLMGCAINFVAALPDFVSNHTACCALIDRLAGALAVNLQASGRAAPNRLETAIRLQNLSFGYEPGQPVLRDVSAEFEAGKSYAVVGASGSGKSTLLRLLMAGEGRYDGNIFYDDAELRTVSTDSLFDLVSLIEQNVFVFDSSIRDNITMFRDFPPDELARAVRLSGLGPLIDAKGCDYRCGENGANLSGGERQRISIARCLLRRAPVLLVDEATAALDKETAFRVASSILDLQGMTRIVVTHALDAALLRRYDGILVLKNGAVVERGQFAELMDRKGYFYSLYTVSQ